MEARDRQHGRSSQPTGMRAFTIVWFGQVVSLLGSAMTAFAFTIWAYQETGEATALALMGFFGFLPGILMSPIAGALVDRWNRKLVMMISDVAAGLSTVAVFLLYSAGNLEIWHLYIAGAFAGAFQAFQWPAYSAAISTMLKKEQYARASGMMALAESLSVVFAPGLAGVLLLSLGIQGVLLIDIITFVFAVAVLFVVYIPQPKATTEGAHSRSNLWNEVTYGFRYIFQRRSLLGLQMMFFIINLTGTLGMILLNPMVLARTGGDELSLATVQSMLGIGGVVGGLLLSVWGGPKRRVHGVLLGMAGGSLFGQVGLGLGQTVPVWAVAAFLNTAIIPILNGSNQAIWQAKVAPDIQGRVFAVRRLIAQITAPAAMLVAGPLADVVFEPAMMPGGTLTPLFGGIVGTGPGAGMALILVFTGILGAIGALSGYLLPFIRNAEDILPDYVMQEEAAESAPLPPVSSEKDAVPVAGA